MNDETGAKPRKYMRYPQAADFLRNLGIQITEDSLRRQVSQGRLPFTKFGKATLLEADRLLDLLSNQTHEPTPRA